MVKIAGVELNRGVLVALMGSLALPALYSVIAEPSMSLSVARFIRGFLHAWRACGDGDRSLSLRSRDVPLLEAGTQPRRCAISS